MSPSISQQFKPSTHGPPHSGHGVFWTSEMVFIVEIGCELLGLRNVVESVKEGLRRILMNLLAILLVGYLVGQVVINVYYTLHNRTGSRINVERSDLATLRGSIDQFRKDCGRYPTMEEGFGALRVRPAGLVRWKGPYLQRDLETSPHGVAYEYLCPGPGGKGYQVRSPAWPGGWFDEAIPEYVDGEEE